MTAVPSTLRTGEPAWTLPSMIRMLSGARVLVADDDLELLEAIADALGRLDADVVRATNGAELIDRLADSGPFDLVVTDIAMPWMTGVRAMRAARLAGLGMSLIVITGLRDPTISAEVRALGRNAALLRKPFEMSEFESVASKLLAERRREPVGLKGRTTGRS
jgi:CheY-like chemotaxis protein